jgi:vacuolar protein sorting-associated protein 13A/C
VILDVSGKDQRVLVGVSWALGLGKYKLCKVVTLAPRFILVNNLPRRLCFREHGGEPTSNSNLEPDAQTPLLLMRLRDEKLITVTYPGLNAQWYVICSLPVSICSSGNYTRSAPVPIQEVGTTHVRVYPPGDNSSPDLVKVATAVESATVFVYFTQETGPWPFRIENDSDFQFWLTQSVSNALLFQAS